MKVLYFFIDICDLLWGKGPKATRQDFIVQVFEKKKAKNDEPECER